MKHIEKHLYTLLGVIAGLALFGMMLLAFTDVSLRKLGAPIRGGVELTELLMVVLMFAGLPLVSMRGEHVGFELVDKYLVGRLRAASIRWMHLVSAVVFAYMGYLMWVYGVRMVSDNLMTAQLGIARGPFAILMALLLMFTAAVHVAYFCVAKESMQTSHEEVL